MAKMPNRLRGARNTNEIRQSLPVLFRTGASMSHAWHMVDGFLFTFLPRVARGDLVHRLAVTYGVYAVETAVAHQPAEDRTVLLLDERLVAFP